MKKIILSLLLCGLMAVSLTACGGNTGQENNHDTATPAGSIILVAYFSLADEQYEVGVVEKGNTQIAAEIIAAQTGADTFSVESTVPYPTTYDGLLEISRELMAQEALTA